MPRHEKTMKDVAWLRKLRGPANAGCDPKMSEWGKPVLINLNTSITEFIGYGRKPSEVKHLSSLRNIKK